MKRQDFDVLVRRIEDRYAGRQAALERFTAGWIWFGLAVILLWICFLTGLGAAAFVAGVVLEPSIGVWLLVLGVLLLVYAISQAACILLVEGTPPEGHVLRPGEAPALQWLLDSLRGELHCRPFYEVRISMRFNAAIREFPRLGLFGWLRSFLEIGLPLAMALSPTELRAVLAHEFAHLSSGHGQSGNRIYRLHRTWCNFMARMQRPSTGTLDRAVRGAILRFMEWYWPRMHARAMVLSRMQELQADRLAASLAGADTMVQALWRIECLNGRLMERFWPDLHELAEHLPEPPPDLFERMREAFRTPPSTEDAARWIERGLSRATDNEDTHPAFAERVRNLGRNPETLRPAGFPGAAEPSAEIMLGAEQAEIEKELVSRWQLDSRSGWRTRNRQALARARRLEAREKPMTVAPAQDLVALWESARETADLRGPSAAEPLLRAVLEHDPTHAGASVLLGHSRLRLGDIEGERLLLQVVDHADETWMKAACRALEEHYLATGQQDRLHHLRARLDAHDAALRRARRERSSVRPGDRFLLHDLSHVQIEPLLRLLEAQPDCSAAWLVRKDLQFFPQRPLFVLCVVSKAPCWPWSNSERDQELVRRLSPKVELPGQVLVITRQGGFRKLAVTIMSRRDSQVYRQKPGPARLASDPFSLSL